jgi:hypothetical protein
MISQWRVRWAERENGRLRSASDAWSYEAADLRSMRSTAAAFTGEPASLPVATSPGERIYLTVTGVRTLEAPNIATIPPLGAAFTPPSAPTGRVPAGIQAGGEGTAVVTSRRLLFLGPGFTREWPYESLTGLLDDARAPMTLLRSAGGSPSGVLIPAAAVKGFRFNLRLAVADAFGERAGLVAQIDQAIGWHEQRRPVPPTPADPMRAPASAWWSPLRASLAGGLALILLLCALGQLLPDSPPKTTDPHDAAKIGVSVTSSPAIATASPPAPTSSHTPAPPALVPTSPAPVPATSKPAVKPATKTTKTEAEADETQAGRPLRRPAEPPGLQLLRRLEHHLARRRHLRLFRLYRGVLGR